MSTKLVAVAFVHLFFFVLVANAVNSAEESVLPSEEEIVDKAKAVYSATRDAADAAGEKVVNGAKTAYGATREVADSAGQKVVEGAKTAYEATKEAADAAGGKVYEGSNWLWEKSQKGISTASETVNGWAAGAYDYFKKNDDE